MSGSPSTFAEALALARNVHDRGFTFLDAARKPTRRSYAELSLRAAALARLLRAQGIVQGQRVVLIGGDPYDFVRGLFALLHIGAVPVPMVPPGFPVSPEQYRRSCAPLLRAALPHGVLAPRGVLELLGPVFDAHAARALRMPLDDDYELTSDDALRTKSVP